MIVSIGGSWLKPLFVASIDRESKKKKKKEERANKYLKGLM
jgi:hypothetical protein